MSVYKLLNKPFQDKSNKFGSTDEVQLKWYEKETLTDLYSYLQSGSFLFLKDIIENADFQIENFPIHNLNELIELSFIKFISVHAYKFKEFLHRWAQRIIISSVDNPVVLNNQIEGKILWRETFRERNYLNYPKSIKFVCMSYKNNYDSLENLLVKSFLTFLRDLLNKYDKHFQFSINRDRKERNKDWKFHAMSIQIILTKVLRNYYMREITYYRDKWRNKLLLNQALRNCHKNNRFILQYAKIFNDLISFKDQELLKFFFMRYIIKPNQDKTAELFVLFSIIKKISSFIGIKENRYLISPTTISKFIFEKVLTEDKIIRVYYQKKPEWLLINYPEESCFAKTIKKYGFVNAELIPDITVEIIHGEEKKITLIEVKNSVDKNYLRKGLHQISDYYDFSRASENSTLVKFENSKNLHKKGYLIVEALPKDWKERFNTKKEDFNIKVLEFKDIELITFENS